MAQNKTTINREAHDKTKGFRLQKLRAVNLMIDSADKDECVMCYWAIEFDEDVYQSSENGDLREENKSYDPETTFTFNSVEVKKALVSFIDIWIKYDYSSSLMFNFYSTNKIGKEKRTAEQKDAGLEFPKEKLLDLAQEVPLKDTFISLVKKLIITEYKSQYEGTENGNIIIIERWDDETWKSFFGQVTWLFGQCDETVLENTILKKVTECRWFSHNYHSGKEEFIKSRLIDLLDERQGKKDFFYRTISKSEVELVFEKAKSGHVVKKDDPIWKMWEHIEIPQDKRNVREKLLARWVDLSESEIAKVARKAVEGGIERQSFENNSDFMSLRYRIYSCCKDKLDEILSRGDNLKYTHVDCIEELKKEACKNIDDLSKSFTYKFDSEVLINNIILELVDNCYLAFDNE